MCGRLFIQIKDGKCYEGVIGFFKEVDEERLMELVKANDMMYKESFLQEYDRKTLNVDQISLKILRIM